MRSEIWNGYRGAGLGSFLEASGEEFFLAFSSFQSLSGFLGSRPPPILKAHKGSKSLRHVTPHWHGLFSPLLPYLKDTCGDTGPTWIIQGNLYFKRNSICKLNSSLPTNLMYSWGSGWTLPVGHYSVFCLWCIFFLWHFLDG